MEEQKWLHDVRLAAGRPPPEPSLIAKRLLRCVVKPKVAEQSIATCSESGRPIPRIAAVPRPSALLSLGLL